jgi:hypothetical protein
MPPGEGREKDSGKRIVSRKGKDNEGGDVHKNCIEQSLVTWINCF